MPVPGLIELLELATARGWPIALVTNAPRPTVGLMIRSLKVERWFPESVWSLGVECEHPKPHPQPYLRGLELCGGAAAETALAFEDSPSGVKAAVAAGIRTVGVLTSQVTLAALLLARARTSDASRNTDR